MGLRLPAVFLSSIALPSDIVLQSPTLHSRVQNFFYLVFLFSILCDNWWRGNRFSLKFIVRFRVKERGVEDRVYLHGLGKIQLVGVFANLLQNLVWTKSPVFQLIGRPRSLDVRTVK